MTLTLHDIQEAAARTAAVLAPTPLTRSVTLSERYHRDIYIKWENKHRTGSFKERGSLNFLSLLSHEQKTRGVCAASAGNHALALSHHAARLKVPCTIVMPVSAPLVKVQSTQATGARVILHGNNFDESYQHAQAFAQNENLEFVPAFDDERIIAGQGTCGLEILNQLSDIDAIVVPVGGGGLMSGVAIAAKALSPQTLLVGAYSEWAMHSRKSPSKKAPLPHVAPTTIADGIAVKGVGSFTQPILDRLVDLKVTLSESEIARAIVKMVEAERSVVEGAGAAALAAIMAGLVPENRRRVVVVVSGSNIDMNVLSRLLERDMGERGRLLKVRVSVPDRPGSLHATTGIIAGAGANVLQVLHDRSFSKTPGNVDITFEVEVRNHEHKGQLLKALADGGIETSEIGF